MNLRQKPEDTKDHSCPEDNRDVKSERNPAGCKVPFLPQFSNSPAAYEPEKDGDNGDYQEYVNDVSNAEDKCSQ